MNIRTIDASERSYDLVVADLADMVKTERPAVPMNPFTGKFMSADEDLDLNWIEATVGGEFLATDDNYDADDHINEFGPEDILIAREESEEDDLIDEVRDNEPDVYELMALAAKAEIAQRAAKKPADFDAEDVEVEAECDLELSFDEDWEFPNLVGYNTEADDFQDSFRNRPVYNNRQHDANHRCRKFWRGNGKRQRWQKAGDRAMCAYCDPAHAWLNKPEWSEECLEVDELREMKDELMNEWRISEFLNYRKIYSLQTRIESLSDEIARSIPCPVVNKEDDRPVGMVEELVQLTKSAIKLLGEDVAHEAIVLFTKKELLAA